MQSIDIKRLTDTVISVKPTTTSGLTKKLMGDNSVTLIFELTAMVPFFIGDYATIFGDIYKLNRFPTVVKKSQHRYEYSMIMQSEQYDLNKAQFMFYDANNDLKEGDFSLTGTPATFIDLLITNINRVSSGWVKGPVVVASFKTMTFAKEDCLTVLARIASAFETEYFIQGTTVSLVKKINQTPYIFEYGYGRGLYDITRSQPDSQTIITRLYAFGSDKNLPPGYPSTRLRLPGGYDFLIHNLTWVVTGSTYNFSFLAPLSKVDAIEILYRRPGASIWFNYMTTVLTSAVIPFPGPGIYEVQFNSVSGGLTVATTPTVLVEKTSTIPIFVKPNALPFLEENKSIYGIIEGDFIDDTILPQRNGVVSSVNATDQYTFSDALMDFDINTNLLPGVPPKITFNTGQLSGYTFEITAYDNILKQFTILKNKDEKLLDIPTLVFRMGINDEYVLTDINMPSSYVTAAEKRLLDKAQIYINKNSSPSYQYIITCDPEFFKGREIKMDIGDVVYLLDSELDINKSVRVVSLTKSLIQEYEYTLELGETVTPSTIAQIVLSTNENTSDIDNLRKLLNNNKLLSGTSIGTLKIEQGSIKAMDMKKGVGTPLVIGADGIIYHT